MKKLSLFLALFYASITQLFAQFTIESPTIHIGETLTQIVANGVFIQDAGEEGENIIWDYSWITEIDNAELTYQETSATGLSDVFTSSNYALTNPDFGEYYNHNDQKTEKVGMLLQSILIDFEDPQTVLEYPLSYGDTFTDTFSGSYIYQGIQITGSGEMTVTADAYGDLTLPYGTVENVMRIKYVATETESYEMNGMPNEDQFTRTSYVWYAESSSILPLFTISFLESDATNQTTVYYLGQTMGLNEELAIQTDFNIYPNPAHESTNIEFTLDQSEEIEITLYSLLGAKIKTITKDNFGPGTHKTNIPLDKIKPGTYFINTKIGTQQISRTLNVH